MVFDRMSKTMVFGWQKVKDHGLAKPWFSKVFIYFSVEQGCKCIQALSQPVGY
jgi:hypothetical protein